MTHGHGSHSVRLGLVSANYFEALGVHIVKGRNFTPEEIRGSGGLAVVISHYLWRTIFGDVSDPIGLSIVLNGLPATVIGMADPEFRGAVLGEQSDLWVPLSSDLPRRLEPDGPPPVSMIGRLTPGRSLVEAQTELTTLWHQIQSDPAITERFKLRLQPYSGTAGGNSLLAQYGNRMLAIFSIVTLLTVAIVCANVANLLIGRAALRQRELALRQSLGASRTRIIRSLLAEGLVLSIVAWATACLLAWWISAAAAAGFFELEAEGLVVLPDLTPDWVVIGYALLLAVLCTIAFTIGPALRTWHKQLLPFLKVGQQGVVHAGSRLSRGLVVLQLAFSVLLLTSAGLAQRSLSLSKQFDAGFDPRNILLATVDTAASADGPEGHRALLDAIQLRLARLPGIDGAALGGLPRWFNFPVRRERLAEPVIAAEAEVGVGYFSALGVSFVAGRDFDERASGTAIITQNLARSLWANESAVGKTLVAGSNEGSARASVDVEVIGVVRDAYFSGQASELPPRYIFFSRSARRLPPGAATFYIRHSGPREFAAPAIARAIRDVNANVPTHLRPLETEVALSVAPVRMLTTLLSLFAAVSLMIAGIGQYAVVLFDGRRRVREFGLRLALGASGEQVIRSVLRENFRATAAGLAVGFLLSVGVGAILARVLYGVTATDPITYGLVFLLLAAASLIACYVPARRASRVDPLIALRTE
jgi:putative ABC transport system permease protein